MNKRIVVCSDGTWNTPDQKDGGVRQPTNVVKMARAIAPRAPDGTVQVVFYDQGVGTQWGLDRFTGGAFGVGLSKNIQDAYRFICQNFSEGDELFLFGFSRGAYTVRSTAGLIRNCGLLRKLHLDKLPDAYALYRDRNAHPDSDQSRRFRQQYSIDVRIKFIGVWDTVGALGIPVRGLHFFTRHRHEFHDVTLSRSVDNAFQALAIDERRRAFKPAIWETQTHPTQTVEQTWFAGVHSNIGGGYKDTGLSDTAFMWMKERAENCGLALNPEYIADVIRANYAGKLRDSKKGLYRLARDYIRPIGSHPNASESVHPAAVQRYKDTALDYAPDNLVKYLQDH